MLLLLLLLLLLLIGAGLWKRNILMLPLLLLLLLLVLWLVSWIPRGWWWCLLPAHRSLRRDKPSNSVRLTLLLHCCYAVVTLRYTIVTPLLHCSYTGVTLVGGARAQPPEA
jgi:hypothetical protein